MQVGTPVGVHLHNTRNTGYANAIAALEAGGACSTPRSAGSGLSFAPRATGNIATEDLVYMLHGEGIETGVDLDALIAIAEWLEGVLGRPLEGQVYRAGTFAPVARLNKRESEMTYRLGVDGGGTNTSEPTVRLGAAMNVPSVTTGGTEAVVEKLVLVPGQI